MKLRLIISAFICAIATTAAMAQGTWTSFQSSTYGPGTCWVVNYASYTTTCSTPTTNAGSCGVSGTSNGTCFVAVAAAGNDSTCISSPVAVTAQASPCATTIKAISIVRSATGFADHIQINRGDRFKSQDFSGSGTGSGGLCHQSGPSSAQPFVIEAYGTGARPQMGVASSNQGFGFTSGAGGGCSDGGINIALVGIDWYNYSGDPNCDTSFYGVGCYTGVPSVPEGVRLSNTFNWFLIEDCKFSFFTAAVDLLQSTQGGQIYLNRSIFVNMYVKDVFAVSFINNISLYGSVLDTIITQTNQNHLVYVDSPITAIGNIFFSDASGMQARKGGTIQYNAFIHSPAAHNFGLPVAGASLSDHNLIINQGDNSGVSAFTPIATFSNYIATPDVTYNVGTSSITNNLIIDSLTPNANGGSAAFDQGQRNSTMTGNIACSQQASTFVDSSIGSILTYGTVTNAGSGYTPGFYGFVPITSSGGSRAVADITVGGGGTITAIDNPGTNSSVGHGWVAAGFINSITGVSGSSTPYTFTATGLPKFPNIGTNPHELFITGTVWTSPSFSPDNYFFVLATSSFGSVVTTNTGETGTWSSGGAMNTGLDDNENTGWWGGTGFTAGNAITTSFGGGSNLAFTVGTVYAGNTLSGNYALDADCNHHPVTPFPDPGLAVGGYYAGLAGASPNQTFTGHITAGNSLVIDAGSPTLNLGDSITWAGQTQDDFIKSGSGPYTMSGANGAISSRTMFSWTNAQFVQAAEASLSPTNFDPKKTACSLVKAIQVSGFAMTNPCNP